MARFTGDISFYRAKFTGGAVFQAVLFTQGVPTKAAQFWSAPVLDTGGDHYEMDTTGN